MPSSSKQEYVCGFLFSEDRSRVVLIRKNRPAWQAGKLNGVGGKIEPGESPAAAMQREFREEAGVEISTWQHVLTLTGSNDAGSKRDWAGHFFRAFGQVDQTQSLTDELLKIHETANLPRDTIPNLRWMIPLMLDEEPIGGLYSVKVVSHRGAGHGSTML